MALPFLSEPIASAWRVLITPPMDGARNMAVDAALLARARRTGEAVLRVYGWSVPTLSLGRHQTARGLYDLRILRDRGIATVRRPTGGRAILHDREVTYSVTAPASDGVTLRATCARINDVLLHALRELGVPAAVVPRTHRAAGPTTAPCFAAPGEGELSAHGRKLVGSAQWREDGAFLQHGSILLEDDQSAIAELMLQPSDPSPPPATLTDLLGRAPQRAEIAEVLVSAVAALENECAQPLDASVAIAESHAFIPTFTDERWTWRR